MIRLSPDDILPAQLCPGGTFLLRHMARFLTALDKATSDARRTKAERTRARQNALGSRRPCTDSQGHHWMMDNRPAGPIREGNCVWCGAVAESPNSGPAPSWIRQKGV